MMADAPYRRTELAREDASSAEDGEEAAATVRPYCALAGTSLREKRGERFS